MLRRNVYSKLRTRLSSSSLVSNGLQPNQLASALIALGNAARDAKRYTAAAFLYDEALRIEPANVAIQVQCGHMFKEAGDLANAEAHYLRAAELRPDDPDLALQLGHFFKVAGRIRDAAYAYRKASELKPGWDEPVGELAALRRHGWLAATPLPPEPNGPDGRGTARADPKTFANEVEALELVAGNDRLVPEIVPRKPHQMVHPHSEGINLRRFGKRERSHWGMMMTFRGVEAIRGFCISATPITEVQVLLNGLAIHRGPVRGGYTIAYERDNADLLKYVFNIWLDFSGYANGRYDLELRLSSPHRDARIHRESIVIEEPLTEEQHPDSDGIVSLPATDGRMAIEQINARPSIVRAAPRAALPATPRNVLILRTDQLGDMVTSIPAMRRLRELLPHAKLVGLLTSSNAEFAATLGLFDEIVVVEFPDDLVDRRRTMPLPAQRALRERLAPYRFELAIDLAKSSMSRPLLLLSGASFLYGFDDGQWPWLSASFESNTRDPKNTAAMAPHSTEVLAVVDRLGSLLRSRAEVVRRPGLMRDGLAARYGIGEGDRFAVLHTGARIAFSRWQHYPALASLLIEKTDLIVVLMADDPAVEGGLPPGLAGLARFRLISGKIPFDEFDALVSFCAVFVGNDSGPKHLASVRGAPVVSIHSARVNWNEWGQEMTGCVVSRKVPCAGCQIYHDPDECGQDYACVTHIKLEEVFNAVMQQLAPLAAEGVG